MIFLELYARMFLALSIALWGVVTITRLFSLDWMPRADPRHGEQLVLSTTFRDKIEAEKSHLPTIPRRVVLDRQQQQQTTLHEDGEQPSPPSGRLTKNKSINDDAPASLPRKHQSLNKVPPPSLRDELYRVDNDGHFIIVHRHNKLHVPFKEANKIENTTKRGDAAKRGHAVDMNVFVDDDGHFVFGHQELPPPDNNPPALTHRRLEVAEDHGGEQMEELQTQLIEASSSSVFDDDGNFVFLRRETPRPYKRHPAESHLRPVKQVTNRESKYPEEYDPQWQKNGRQPRRIFTAEPEPEQETKSDREMEPDNDSMAMLGPTILVAIAAIVIVCAAILYLCDLRDRCRYNQHWKKQRPKQKQQQPRRRNAGTSFPLDMIVTPSQKHHKKNPLSLSNDHNPSHPHSIDAGDIDPQQAAAVDWIRSIMPSSPISMEDQVPAQSPMMTSPVDLDEDHDIHLASLRIPAPDEDPVETPSLDIPTPHAGPIATAALTDRCAATYDEEEESQPTLLPVHDKVATGVDPEGKRTIDTTSPARPKAMLSPAAASALSPTRSGISILTEVSSDEEDTHDDDEELVTTPSQQFLRRELVSEEEEVDVTTTLANSKKMFTVPSSMERSPETLLEEERDATHQHPKAPNDDGDDELRIVELTEQTDEHSRLEHLVTSFSYHSEDDGSHEDFIRDIFYVPTTSTAGTKDISLQFIGASCPVTHPMITFVGDESPLVGRVFVGDFILRINEQEAGGMSSDDVLKFLVRSPRNEEGHVAMGSKAVSVKMIKLTVMSSHADGSDTEASVDIGRANSATEV